MAFIDPKIGGTVTLAKGLEKNLTTQGVLYVVITGKNVVIEGASLVGPLHVIARYSISGDALDKKRAIEGFDPKFPSTEIGNKNLNIELKTVLK